MELSFRGRARICALTWESHKQGLYLSVTANGIDNKGIATGLKPLAMTISIPNSSFIKAKISIYIFPAISCLSFRIILSVPHPGQLPRKVIFMAQGTGLIRKALV